MKLWKTNEEFPTKGIGRNSTIIYHPILYGKECLVETNNNEVYLCYAVYDSQMEDETIPFYFSNDSEHFLMNEVKRWCYIDDIRNIK